MERGQPFIRLKLDVKEPIELSEFVSAFTSLAAEYDRYSKSSPDMEDRATLYVRDVRDGCIVAEIVQWGAALVGTLAGANVIADFVKNYGHRIGLYKKPGGRAPHASRAELTDFSQQVAAIASNPNSSLSVAAIEIVNGKEVVRQAFKFDTTEAREIQQRVEEHRREMDHFSRSDRERVLMIFIRSDIRDAELGKRSGELVEIAEISEKPRPLIYASGLAEQQIKSEITTDDSVYKKGFVVDVNVEIRGGRVVAYAVTNLHSVIDLPDD